MKSHRTTLTFRVPERMGFVNITTAPARTTATPTTSAR